MNSDRSEKGVETALRGNSLGGVYRPRLTWFCMRSAKSTVTPYVVALLATVLALMLRWFLDPVLMGRNPYHTVWAAVVFSAWYCGLGPSIVTAISSALGVWFFFLPPYHSFAIENSADRFGLVGFLVLSGFIVALGEANRRAKSTRRKAEQELQKAYDGLENRVKERTAELEEANQTLRLLSVRLAQAQDEERRRIARELHDSVGQYLAATAMALDSVRQEATNLPASANRKLDEAAEITKACVSEIRTISHLLHPPLLEELGIAAAVRFYVEGFAARSGIRADLEMPEELGRLGNEIEIVLFRVLQESLTNIHRHSGSKTATIKVGADSDQAWMEVQDQGNGNGNGNSALFRPGVGITGMRERLKALAGALEIASDQNGTRVKAVIPLTRTSSAGGLTAKLHKRKGGSQQKVKAAKKSL